MCRLCSLQTEHTSFGLGCLTSTDHWMLMVSGVLQVWMDLWRVSGPSLHWKQEQLWSAYLGFVQFWIFPKLKASLCYSSNVGVFPWETFFFFNYLFILCVSHVVCVFTLCPAALQLTKSLFYSSVCLTTTYLEDMCRVCNLGNNAAPPDLLALGNVSPAWHTLGVLLNVCARHRAQARCCSPGLGLLWVRSSSSQGWPRIFPLSLLYYCLREFGGFDFGWLPAGWYPPSCSATSPQVEECLWVR